MNAQVTKLATKEPPEVDTTARNVYQLVAAVMADIAREGIAKDRNNATQGYKFRGIDDVYNALSPIMSRHGLLMLPCVLSREVVERQTQKGGALFNVTVEVEFTLVSAGDGSTHVIRTFGEAMDSADKATNKAMSAAFKYAAMQAFCIPTEGDNDADAVTHQVASAEEQAIKHLRAVAIDRSMFKDAWGSNKDAWKRLLPEDSYRRVVAVMQQIAAAFPKEVSAPLAPPAPSPFDAIGDDEIPY